MRLYHYTSRGHYPHILASALSEGDIPVGPAGEQSYRGVWFTTDPDAAGHGLSGGAADKREVRITVVIQSTDRDLHRWLPWTRKRLGADVIERLVGTGGGKRKAETWYVYSQPIPPQRFAAVEFRREDGSYSPATPEEIIAIEPHVFA